MPEPFFAGPVASVAPWPVSPSAAFGLPQAPMFGGHATMGGILNALPASSSYVVGSPMMTNPFAQTPWLAAAPAWHGQEPVATLSAPGLIGAVASRRGQPAGPTTDQDIETVLYDALEMLSGTDEVDVRCESGRVTITGSVQTKRVKRDVGEITWAIPAVNDVQNNVTIAARRRGRPREVETQPQPVPSRKQA